MIEKWEAMQATRPDEVAAGMDKLDAPMRDPDFEALDSYLRTVCLQDAMNLGG